MTLTLSWHGLIMCAAYHLTKATFDQSLMTILPRVKEIFREHEIPAQSHDLQLWPWPRVYMVSSWILWTISLRWTFDQTEIPSKSNRDMEGTRNSKFKLVAFNCYLDLRGGVGWGGVGWGGVGWGGVGRWTGGMVEWWIMHIISLRWTFHQSLRWW